MKQMYLTILFAMLMSMVGAKAENRENILNAQENASGVVIEINEENFPDEKFRSWLLQQSYGQDGVLTKNEIAGITEINVNNCNISSLEGIKYFTELIWLYCHSNQLTSLDVTKNTALKFLNCYHNQLASLDVSKNTALIELRCYENQLTSLDISKNTALEELFCDYNQLTNLDVTKNTALKYLYCYHNQLANLDVSKNTTLKLLNCSYNQLTSLDVSKNTTLTTLSCAFNQLTSLDVSKNRVLISLSCSENQIKGEAMDVLISSLPQNLTDEKHSFSVYYSPSTGGNVCTKSQVVAAKSKGWTSYDDYSGKEYEGSDE